MPRVAMAVAAVLFVVAAASTAILAVPFMNPDNLAYQAWGEQLRDGSLPTVANALTTPHPAPILLMAVLAGIVSPLATWAALAIAGLAGVVAGAVLVAWRRAGATGAGAALLLLGLGRLIWIAGPLRGIDWLAAGAIGIALALPPERRRLRLVALVAAGLVRPEAWLLPPLSAFATERRVRPALLWGLAAPVLWCAFDSILFHDPLLAFHRTDALAGIAAPGPGLGDVRRQRLRAVRARDPGARSGRGVAPDRRRRAAGAGPRDGAAGAARGVRGRLPAPRALCACCSCPPRRVPPRP